MLAIALSVVATLVVVALAGSAVYLLRAARALRLQAEALAKEAAVLLAEIRAEVSEAGAEVERVERMVGSAEALSETLGSASRLVGGVVAAPVIKALALWSGVSAGLRSLGGQRRPPRRR